MRKLLLALAMLGITSCAWPEDRERDERVYRADWYRVETLSKDKRVLLVSGEGAWNWQREAAAELGVKAVSRRCEVESVTRVLQSYAVVVTMAPCQMVAPK